MAKLFLIAFTVVCLFFGALVLLPGTTKPRQPAKAPADSTDDPIADSGLWPYEEIERDVLPGIKFSVTLRVSVVDGKLPNRSELKRISDWIAFNNRGYERYFVALLVPGQPNNEGAFATAHRDPDCEVRYPFAGMWSVIPFPAELIEAAEAASNDT